MGSRNIVEEIVERKKQDVAAKGYTFGIAIPEKRERPVVPFMAEKGVILEVKRASPSKGDIAPGLDSAKTALGYQEIGARAISVLTEENYFKGSLQDLINVCSNVRNTAILRKDFLIDEEEIEIAYRCGADAVLLISGILDEEKLYSMCRKVNQLGIKALVELRTVNDVKKVQRAEKDFSESLVYGVNSRNLKNFTIDLLQPFQIRHALGKNVIFESGILNTESAAFVRDADFLGILCGEAAAKNKDMAKAIVETFCAEKAANQKVDFNAKLAKILLNKNREGYNPLVKVCGLTRKEDALFAKEQGADFLGTVLSKGFGRTIDVEKGREIAETVKGEDVMVVAVITETDSPEAKAAADFVRKGVYDCLQLHNITPEDFYNSDLTDVPYYFTWSNPELCKATGNKKIEQTRILQDNKTHDYVPDQNLWLAGGVTPENVGDLIKEHQPELVDVSSGLEDDQVGVKNHEKITKFFKKVEETVCTMKA